MSIAVAVRKAGEIALATDSQTSFGGIRIPTDNLKTDKVHEVGEAFLATTGWGLYENILNDFLARRPRTVLSDSRSIFAFFLEFWKALHDRYSMVKDQSDKEDDSPFGNLDTSFLVVSPNGIFCVSSDMSVTRFEKFYAIGSGADFSLGALATLYDLSDDARELGRKAVEAAIAFDLHCGGDITVRSVVARAGS